MNSNQMAAGARAPSVSRWIVLVALAGAAALGASAICSALFYGADAKAAFDRRAAAEITQENQASCTKLGLAAGTTAGTACIRELNEVRRLHDERRVRDDTF